MSILRVGAALAPFALVALPIIAGAQGAAPQTAPQVDIRPDNLLKIVCRVADWLFVFLIALAVVFVIIAAFRYLFIMGDSANAGKATGMLVFAAVAVAVALVAKGLPLFISGLLGGNLGSVC